MTTGAYTPDWQGIINADPAYQALLNQQNAAHTSDLALRNSGLGNALVGFGALPDLAGVDLGDFQIDPALQAAVAGNTASGLSQTAQMERTHNTNLRNLQDMLAAHGILQSGALRSGIEGENLGYESAQAKARKDLIDLLQGLQKGYADNEAARAGDRGDLFNSLLPVYAKDPRFRAKEGHKVKATLDRSTGYYVDPDGNYYDRNGNPVDLGATVAHNQHRRRRQAPAVPPPAARPSGQPGGGYQP